MPSAFEEKNEEKEEEPKKKKAELIAKPEAMTTRKDFGPPADIKTIMEIRDIRETVKKGREIVARKKAQAQPLLKPPNEGAIERYVDTNDDSIMGGLNKEPEKSPPPKDDDNKGAEERERKGSTDRQKKFEEMIRKLKNLLK